MLDGQEHKKKRIVIKMKLEEFIDTFFLGQELYINTCACGREQHIRTQKDDNPEYYTDIFIKCSCGEWIKFSLPVN